MKIGLIADHLSIERVTGIARYAREMRDHLLEEGFSVTIITVPRFTGLAGEFVTRTVRLPMSVLKRARACDILHATSPVTALPFPFLWRPKVTTFHDLISILHTKIGTRFHVRLMLPWAFGIAERYSDKLIVPSVQTQNELIEHLCVDKHKIRVIPYGISPIFSPVERRSHEGLIIGYVGALAPRKRVDSLLRAFHILVERHPEHDARLQIYGSRDQQYAYLMNLAENLGISGRVEFCGFATDQDLPKIYNSMDVLVLPSDWEGFGYPIMEAQRCGTPVIIRSDARISPEIGQCCVKADSEEEMSRVIDQIFTDPSRREQVIQQGLDYTQRFTWNQTIKETIRVYEEAINDRIP